MNYVTYVESSSFQKPYEQPLRDLHYSILFFKQITFICCVDIMSIFVSYMNRGADVPRAYRYIFVKVNDNCNMVQIELY